VKERQERGQDPVGRTGAEIPTVLIRPSQRWVPLELKDLWEFRGILYFLIWRDVKVRYKQTALGTAWAVLQPFVTMVVFSIIFGWLVRMPSDGVPYPIFAFTALLPWQLFVRSLTASSNSIVANESLITKVYFPRLVIPLSATAVGVLDFAIASVVLLGMMAYYHIVPASAVWMTPLFVLLAIATAFGVGLWLSALNVQYRDVGHALPFVTQMWMFATPIVYPSSLIPEQWRALYGLNPMSSVVEGFRWTLLGTGSKPGPMLMASVLMTFVVLVSGLYYFRRAEQTFADSV
jgi:lipopolysaccharide transport system permease protein